MVEIEVKVAGVGVVVGDEARLDAGTAARCDVCSADVGMVASVPGAGGAIDACPDCLRGRLDAMSVARWRLQQQSGEAGGRLPWGKLTS